MKVTSILRATYAPTLETRALLDQVFKSHERKRVSVIEPSLCTTSLEILKPSLPAPGTCDIIDINPGACIWSQYLHDVVQPRRHILVEKDLNNFRPIIQPLLDSGDSYKYAQNIRTASDPQENLLSTYTNETVTTDLPHSAKKARERFNNNLLLTANLSGRFIRTSAYTGVPSKHFLEQYYRSLTSRSTSFDIHRNGLVRLLAWIPEKDKYSLIPRSVVSRHPQSIRLEASCHIREIVSSYPYSDTASLYRKWYNADMENVQQVADRPNLSEFEVPVDRVQPMPERPSASLVPDRSSFKEMIQLEMRPMMVDELVALDKHLESTDPDWLARYVAWKPARRLLKAGRPVYTSADQVRYNELMIRIRVVHEAYKRVEKIVNEQRAIEDRVVGLRRQYRQNSKRYEKRLQCLDAELSDVRNATSKLFKDSRHAIEKAIDDYRAMRHEPPTLAWNGRDMEPILSKKSDFFPQTKMTLVEFTPKLEFIQAFDTAEKQVAFDYIVSRLEWEKAKPVSVALKRIVGEAYDEFVTKLPNFFDPLKGGWYNLDHITPRTLPTTLMMELALAFEKWTHRPSLTQMLSTLTVSLRTRSD